MPGMFLVTCMSVLEDKTIFLLDSGFQEGLYTGYSGKGPIQF